MRRVWGLLVSIRATALLLAVLAALLVVNAALPQAAVDPEAYALAVRRSRGARLALETLQLGHLATSPLFIACIGLFFANLAAVLVDRAGATLRRVRLRPPAAAQLAALLASPGVLDVPGPAPSEARAAEALAALGYRIRPVPGGVWGVKNRLAPLGFPLFHLSFFALLAGGLQIYLTRDVRTLIVAEGRQGDTGEGAVVRPSPLGAAPPLRIALERVETRLEGGRPVALAATIALDGGPPETARVNHPVERGPVTVLVERAGVAPVLWLTDGRGYTLDRVLAPIASRAGVSTRIPLASGDLEAAVKPIPLGPAFPERGALPSVPLEIRVRSGDQTVFAGVARPGEPIAIGARTLRVQEVRYWAELRIVRERGGALLVLGFALAVAGIVWRMLLFRREAVVVVQDGRARIAGRGEFFPSRIRDEVAVLRDLLAAAGTAGDGPRRAG